MRKDLTWSNKTVICKNASLIAYGKATAKRGDWLVYSEGNGHIATGRMVGTVSATGTDGDPFKLLIAVIKLREDLRCGYIQSVDPDDVREIDERPFTGEFLKFLMGDLPSAEICHKLSDYGTLSDEYIEHASHHIEAWEAGVSPAAYDAFRHGSSIK